MVVKPLLVSDDNNDNKSFSYDSQVNLNPNDPIVLGPLIHLNPLWDRVPVPVVPTHTNIDTISHTTTCQNFTHYRASTLTYNFAKTQHKQNLISTF